MLHWKSFVINGCCCLDVADAGYHCCHSKLSKLSRVWNNIFWVKKKETPTDAKACHSTILQCNLINLIFVFGFHHFQFHHFVLMKCSFMRLTLSDYSVYCLLRVVNLSFLIRSIHTLDTDTSFNFKMFSAQCSTGFVVFIIIYICCVFLPIVGWVFHRCFSMYYVFLFRILNGFLCISYEQWAMSTIGEWFMWAQCREV